MSKPYDLIALEDLTDIRNGKKNKKLGKWSFAELRSIVKPMLSGKDGSCHRSKILLVPVPNVGSRIRKIVTVGPSNVKALV